MSDKIVIHDDSDLKELNFQPIKITPLKGKSYQNKDYILNIQKEMPKLEEDESYKIYYIFTLLKK
ncbi:hypothetical protein [Sphingobacterium alimentarium]|nr:hypothetical protein [Sphingobacterium alimentarium]